MDKSENKQKLTKELFEEINKKVDEGGSIEELCKEYNVSESTFRYRIKQTKKNEQKNNKKLDENPDTKIKSKSTSNAKPRVASEVNRIKELEDEIAYLKEMYIELSMDYHKIKKS